MKIPFLLISLIIISFFQMKVEATGNLQELIDETPDYGQLVLNDHVYEGNLVIDKPITIIGTDSTVIRGDGTGNVITVKGKEVHLEKLQLENSSFARGEGEEYAGLKVIGDHNTFKNLQISNSYHGIYLSQSHNNVIESVIITGQKGQETIAGQGNGVHIYYSNGNTIQHNVIDGTRDGIYFEYSHENMLSHNEISHTRYGLHYMYSDENVFQQNSFMFNIGGAAVMESKGNEFSENHFSMNQSSRSFGFLLQSSSNNELKENYFTNNKRGLLIEKSNRNEILSNQFFQNDIGIEVWASSSQQIISGNQFYKNQTPVIQVGGHSENEWSLNGQGNDWGDIPILDLNQDGIGDFPITYFSSLHQLVEENELAYLLINSPSIVVFEKMNHWMNNQRAMFQDDFPLQHRKTTLFFNYFIVAIVILSVTIKIYKSRRESH